jgi:hypothetical protein
MSKVNEQKITPLKIVKVSIIPTVIINCILKLHITSHWTNIQHAYKIKFARYPCKI